MGQTNTKEVAKEVTIEDFEIMLPEQVELSEALYKEFAALPVDMAIPSEFSEKIKNETLMRQYRQDLNAYEKIDVTATMNAETVALVKRMQEYPQEIKNAVDAEIFTEKHFLEINELMSQACIHLSKEQQKLYELALRYPKLTQEYHRKLQLC